MQQIHDFGMYISMDAKSLSREDKMKALSSLMFILEKRDGRVKAQKCAVGSNQRSAYSGIRRGDNRTVTTWERMGPQERVLH